MKKKKIGAGLPPPQSLTLWFQLKSLRSVHKHRKWQGAAEKGLHGAGGGRAGPGLGGPLGDGGSMASWTLAGPEGQSCMCRCRADDRCVRKGTARNRWPWTRPRQTWAISPHGAAHASFVTWCDHRVIPESARRRFFSIFTLQDWASKEWEWHLLLPCDLSGHGAKGTTPAFCHLLEGVGNPWSHSPQGSTPHTLFFPYIFLALLVSAYFVLLWNSINNVPGSNQFSIWKHTHTHTHDLSCYRQLHRLTAITWTEVLWSISRKQFFLSLTAPQLRQADL